MRSGRVTIALAVLASTAASAQAVVGHAGLDRGTRIRITDAVRNDKREGVLVEWRRDSALARIDASGETVIVPPELVRHLEVYDGTQSGAGKGALVGGSIGLGLSVLYVLAASSDDWTAPTAGEAVAVGALNTALFAGIGALIGGTSKKAKWRPMGLASQVQAVLTPAGQAGLGVRIGF